MLDGAFIPFVSHRGIKFHEEIDEKEPIKCMKTGDDAIKWKLLQGTILKLLYRPTSLIP